MKLTNLLFFLALYIPALVNAQVGVGTLTPDPSAKLEVSGTSRGFLPPRLTTVERNLINNPASGLIVFNTTLGCLQVNHGTPALPVWNCFSDPSISSTSNGTAIIESASCSTATNGSPVEGKEVSGVSQTITFQVSKVGSYSFSAGKDGLNFTANGEFSTTGLKDVQLVASGAPASSGIKVFNLDILKGCSFNREIYQASTNGTAKVSGYSITNLISGSLNRGVPASGVSITIQAQVITAGTYSLTAVKNGVTFSASGIFTTTGTQPILLIASGTPLAAEISTFTLNTNPSCSFNFSTPGLPANGNTFTNFSNGSQFFSSNPMCGSSLISAGHSLSTCTGNVTVGTTIYNQVFINGQCWMKENLKTAPTAGCTDNPGFGCNNWTAPSPAGDALHWGYYNTANPSGSTGWAITEPAPDEGMLYGWEAAMNGSQQERSQGVCPEGWHIPSDCEWQFLEHGLGMNISTQIGTGSRTNGGIGSKLSTFTNSGNNSSGFTALLSGIRNQSNGSFSSRASGTTFWTSTESGNNGISITNAYTRGLVHTSVGLSRNISYLTSGTASVRCIRN